LLGWQPSQLQVAVAAHTIAAALIILLQPLQR
jgi:hypothetical protein